MINPMHAVCPAVCRVSGPDPGRSDEHSQQKRTSEDPAQEEWVPHRFGSVLTTEMTQKHGVTFLFSYIKILKEQVTETLQGYNIKHVIQTNFIHVSHWTLNMFKGLKLQVWNSKCRCWIFVWSDFLTLFVVYLVVVVQLRTWWSTWTPSSRTTSPYRTLWSWSSSSLVIFWDRLIKWKTTFMLMCIKFIWL